MSQLAVTIRSLASAHDYLKGMGEEVLFARESVHVSSREALATAIEDEMAYMVDSWLEGVEREGGKDRRNGYYKRHLLSGLGDIELDVPRTRKYTPKEVLRAYARRSPEIDDMILSAFVLGLSTRKVGEAVLTLLGRPVSAETVSRVSKRLDQAVAAFHRRRLSDSYQALMLDGVVMRRKTGAGSVSRPVLVALGLRPDGKKEVIDYAFSNSESAAEWSLFLTRLLNRGLKLNGLDMIVTDGGAGLGAALPEAMPGIPVQRCWAHKIRNILAKTGVADRDEAKSSLHRIMHATGIAEARKAARSFADRFEDAYPNAVACLRGDLDELLTCFRYSKPEDRKRVRTTNAIERRFLEVRRRTRPMGIFQDKTSMDRILFAVFTYENKRQGISTLLPLTHNC